MSTINSILKQSTRLIKKLENRLRELETTNAMLEQQQLAVIIQIDKTATEHKQGTSVVNKLKDIFGAIPS